MSTGTKAASGAGVLLALVISIFNLSSPMAIWAMANQFQLYMLLLLTKTSIPSDVSGYITGNQFMTFSMNFIPLNKIPVIELPLEWMNFDQSLDELEEMGIISGSSLNNIIGFLFTIVLIAMTHL